MPENHLPLTTAPPSSRWKKLLFWLLIPPVVLALAVFFYTTWHHYHLLSQIEAEQQLIVERGEPLTVKQLAAEYYLPDDADDPTRQWVSIIDEIEPLTQKPAYQALPIVGESKASVPFPGDAWEQEALVTQLLREAEPALERLTALQGDPANVRYPLDFEQGYLMDLGFQKKLYRLTRLLSLRARWQVYHDESEGACESLVCILRAAQTVKHEPTRASQLRRNALLSTMISSTTNLLPHANWSEAELQRLQQELLKHDDLHGSMQWGLIGDRALGSELIADPSTIEEDYDADLGAVIPVSQLHYLQTMRAIIAALDLPHQEASSALQSIGEEMNRKPSLLETPPIISVLLLPHPHSTLVDVERTTTRLRAAATLIACERYHMAHGTWPEQLADLVPQFMKSIPLDPKDDQPLRYKVTPEAVVVYSIGWDLVDDGGGFIDEENTVEPDVVSRRKLKP